jgi:hypothetical protein
MTRPYTILILLCLSMVGCNDNQIKRARYVREHQCKLNVRIPDIQIWDDVTMSMKTYPGYKEFSCDDPTGLIIIPDNEIQP